MRRGWLLGAVGWAWAAQAIAAAGAAAIEDLVETGHGPEAYRQYAAEAAAHAGEPDYDLWYGIAAVDSGHAGEGIFALERVLAADPANARARLELGRAFLLLGDAARARTELEAVRAAHPPAPVAEKLEQLAAAAEQADAAHRPSTHGYVQMGLGYDDNVNAAPDAGEINTALLGPVLIGGQAVQHGDGFAGLGAGLSARRPVTAQWGWFANLDGSGRFYGDRASFNQALASYQVGAAGSGPDSAWSLSTLGQEWAVGARTNRELLGVAGDYTHGLGAGLRGTLSANLMRLYYPGQPLRASRMWTLGAGVSRPGPVTLAATAYYGGEISDTRTPQAEVLADRDLWGVVLRAATRWDDGVELGVRLTGQVSDYRGYSVLFAGSRTDRLLDAAVEAAWHFAPAWSWLGSVGYTDNHSDMPIYDFKRAQVSTALRYDF